MTEPTSMSPTPTIISPITNNKTLENTMDFPEAMRQIIEGKKIHKLEWEDKEYFGFLNQNILSLHKPDGKNYQWVISDGDLMGDDYIVI